MELRHIRSFVLISKAASFSDAAFRCYVTQSSGSQHIKALEKELECKFLIRSSRNIVLFSHTKKIVILSNECVKQTNVLINCVTSEPINIRYVIETTM